MTVIQQGPAIPSIRPLYRLIRQTRALLRMVRVTTGLSITWGLFLGLATGIALIDLVFPLRPSLRLAGLLIIVVPVIAALVAGVIVPLCRRLPSGQMARRIEGHIPNIHNRLVSLIDLDKAGSGREYSPAFYGRLLAESLEKIGGFRAGQAIGRRSVRRAVAFAFVCSAIFACIVVMFSSQITTALARIFNPFADIPPYSGISYFVKIPDKNAKVLRSDNVVFIVEVTEGEPSSLQLEITNETNTRSLTYDLRKQDENHWSVALDSTHIGDGFDHSFTYRIRGGGTWTQQDQVTILDRPAIAELSAAVFYPDYMGIAEPRLNPPQIADVSGPVGSRVEIRVRAEGDVEKGEIQFLEIGQRPLKLGEQKERTWFDGTLPAGATTEGNWDWDDSMGRRCHTEPPFVGTHGHWFQGALRGFSVAAGEKLFAYVFMSRDDPPGSIMLQWHDGGSWDHRAYWGSDTIALGKTDTPGHRRMGPLPPAGQWARLEVPAEAVNLQDKILRGMSFTLSGGKCFWQRVGAFKTEDAALTPVRSVPLQNQSDGSWAGSFPLTGNGWFRVELRNALHLANKPMKEASLTAILDQVPQIVLERPGADLVITEASIIPLTITAFDDFGLAEISLAYHHKDKSDEKRISLKKYEKPQRNDSLASYFDLAALSMSAGDEIWYRAEATDRKGQVGKTKEFAIRLAGHQSAARDLEDLHRFVADLRKDLQIQESKQKDLQNTGKRAPDSQLANFENKQARLDRQTDKLLKDTNRLQGKEQIDQGRNQRAGDQNRPSGKQDSSGPTPRNGKPADPNSSEEDDAVKPAVGEQEVPASSPEAKQKQLPIAPAVSRQNQDASSRRKSLDSHQEKQLGKIQQARKSLAADEQSLKHLARQVQQLMNQPKQSPSSPGEKGARAGQPNGEQTMAQIMQSPGLRSALGMVNRMREMQRGGQTRSAQAPASSEPDGIGNREGTPPVPERLGAEWSKLDLETRSAILNLQPKLREELIQGLREEGPMGYRPFIDDYFKRLTEVNKANNFP